MRRTHRLLICLVGIVVVPFIHGASSQVLVNYGTAVVLEEWEGDKLVGSKNIGKDVKVEWDAFFNCFNIFYTDVYLKRENIFLEHLIKTNESEEAIKYLKERWPELNISNSCYAHEGGEYFAVYNRNFESKEEKITFIRLIDGNPKKRYHFVVTVKMNY